MNMLNFCNCYGHDRFKADIPCYQVPCVFVVKGDTQGTKVKETLRTNTEYGAG